MNTLDEDVILYRSGKKGGLTIPGQEQNDLESGLIRNLQNQLLK